MLRLDALPEHYHRFHQVSHSPFLMIGCCPASRVFLDLILFLINMSKSQYNLRSALSSPVKVRSSPDPFYDLNLLLKC